MRGKIIIKKRGGAKQKIKIRYLSLVFLLVGMLGLAKTPVQAEGCLDLKIIFARGSGSERNNSQDYLNFKETIETKLATTSLKYDFVDLDYPAVGISDIGTALGAFFGAGDAYEFGDSIKTGVKNLTSTINGASCPGTKYVIGGYSQGAMVVSKALGSLNKDRVIYAATFGDPKLYLPEGKGLLPAACRGENLSDYRMYVPDCRAYKGLLGASIPYEPDEMVGKVGTWCNKMDIFCSSYFSLTNHVSYVTDNLYEDASRVIFDKITKEFGIINTISSPHDTAILIDSTGSMARMIDQYKAEALRLAQETLDSGGRVALYDYRDLSDPYQPVKHCDFNTCTLDLIRVELDALVTADGGDTPESLMSASLHVMQDLEWKRGATKSLVVLTDADFLSPDRDGASLDEVIALSKRIDPVNFYIITTAEYSGAYTELAERTDGRVVTNFDELSLLTDYIMERYDSLPRVEEMDASELGELPTLEIENVDKTLDDVKVNIELNNGGLRTLVALNDAILGITEETEITITGLRDGTENNLTLVPLGANIRGEAVELNLSELGKGNGTGSEQEKMRDSTDESSVKVNGINTFLPTVPKAPNTGGYSAEDR